MKKYKIDKTGKSHAIFIQDKIPVVHQNDFKKLIGYKTNIRYCLHRDRKSKLQCMINLIRKNSLIKMHKHTAVKCY